MTGDQAAEARARSQALRQQLDARQVRLREWCDDTRNAARAARDQGLERIVALGARITDLRKEHDELESAGYANEIILKAQQRKVTDLQHDLENLRNSENALETQMSGIRAKKTAALGTVEAAQEAVQVEQDKQAHQRELLTRGARLYKKLGIDFDNIGGKRMRVTYTKVDPADPARVFYFITMVTDDDAYIVEQVHPGVGSVQDLLDDLNASNDFSLFVRSMRKRFRALCA
mmetsp:Transcript_5066/g.12998  ORF Transcript_5066/g.12998 Transcript_5066/m.12998 type:complete len:232 (-) Transcript_5066:190-885(-)